MFKLVLDTNVFVSAFFWEGNESELFKRIEKGKAIVFMTIEILNEIEDVIKRPKFKHILLNVKQTPDKIIQKIISVSNIVISSKLNISVCRDPKDNMFLECGINCNADYIVFGDEDLLILKKYKNIKIVSASEILKLL